MPVVIVVVTLLHSNFFLLIIYFIDPNIFGTITKSFSIPSVFISVRSVYFVRMHVAVIVIVWWSKRLYDDVFFAAVVVSMR